MLHLAAPGTRGRTIHSIASGDARDGKRALVKETSPCHRRDLLPACHRGRQRRAIANPFGWAVALTGWDRASQGSVTMAFMSHNESGLDRAIRVVAGLGLISLVYVGPQTPWGWIGLVLVVTGLVGWCPIYATLNLSTLKVRK
jgi:hypothetical protein